MYDHFENKNYFYCKITDSLISEYNVPIDSVLKAKTYKGVYWEAAVYFDNNDFTLNAFAEKEDGVKEVEVLKFPLKKINKVKIYEVIYETKVRTKFKISLIAGAAFSILVLLTMLIHPSPGYSDIGFIIFSTLFLGGGMAAALFVIQFFIYSSKKNICVNLMTHDKRIITLFTDTEQKAWVIEILSKYFNGLKNKGLPFWNINLN